jgi:hypothetical protein
MRRSWQDTLKDVQLLADGGIAETSPASASTQAWRPSHRFGTYGAPTAGCVRVTNTQRVADHARMAAQCVCCGVATGQGDIYCVDWSRCVLLQG